jgi:hypothetical protein
MTDRKTILWNTLVELRKEILQAQKIRAKLLTAKITSVGAGIGLIYANIGKIDPVLLLVPAFAAIFFDLLINSYSISTKRIGFYCRHYLEPGLLNSSSLPVGFISWENFVNQRQLQQNFSFFGNLGLTGIITILAAIYVLDINRYGIFPLLLLVLLFLLDIYLHVYPTSKIARLPFPNLVFSIEQETPNNATQPIGDKSASG